MICRPKSLWICSCLFIIAVNVIILFVLIPEASSRINQFYSSNRYADGYDQLADNLAEGNGYRFYPDTAETLMREPGYPMLLAGIFMVFGKNFAFVKLANLILALAVAYLMTRIARKLSDNRLLILGSPLLFLFHPETLIAESRGGIEILFTLMLTLFTLTVYRAVKSNRWWDYLLSGAVLGLAVLVRSTPILFPVVLLGYFLLFERAENQKVAILRNFILMTVAMFIVLSPWIIRNYSLTGKFVPTASVLGVSAHTGLYLSTHQAIGNLLLDTEAASERSKLAHELGYHFKDGYYQYFYSSADEVTFSQYLFNRVVHEYESSPLLFIKTVGLNFLKFWCGGKTWKAVAMNAIVQLPFLALAIMGIVRCLRNDRSKELAPLVLLIIYIVAVSMPILAQARYSEPLNPFLSILAFIPLVMARRTFNSAKLHDEAPTPFIEETRPKLVHMGAPVEKPAPRAPRDEIRLSIVIPAYNEQERLPQTVLQTIHWCTITSLDFELIIVDDGSRDGTLALARLFEETDRRIRVFACPHMGKGAAVRMGMLNAHGRFVLFMDADGATPLNEVPKLVAAIEAGSDVAIGSRVAHCSEEVEVKASFHRRFVGRAFSFLVNLLAFEGIADTQCGFKMFRCEAAAAIFSLQKTVGFAFDVEILFIARQLSLSVAEIPVNWIAQPGSKVNIATDSIRMLWDISRIRWLHRNFYASIRRVHGSQLNHLMAARQSSPAALAGQTLSAPSQHPTRDGANNLPDA
jgi:dolichyl-phosphate beta-glucosyltransferase